MPRDPLELETRRRVYALLAEAPGLHLREIARRVDMDVRTAMYHLDQLARHGLAVSVEEGGFLRFFPRTLEGAEMIDARDKPVLGVLRKRMSLYIALFLLTREAATHGEILAGAGVAPSTLSYHLGRLGGIGVVWQEGSVYRLRDPDRVARLLYAYRPSADLLDGFVDLWEDFTL